MFLLFNYFFIVFLLLNCGFNLLYFNFLIWHRLMYRSLFRIKLFFNLFLLFLYVLDSFMNFFFVRIIFFFQMPKFIFLMIIFILNYNLKLFNLFDLFLIIYLFWFLLLYCGSFLLYIFNQSSLDCLEIIFVFNGSLYLFFKIIWY